MLKARIKFRKYGCMKFIGHLDVMRFFQKVMRRADIPIAFSGGYSPHMIMSFAQPLGIGLTSDGEYLDIELTEPIDSKEAVARMNAVSVEGIEMVSMVQISEEKKASGMTITAASDYQVFLLESGKSSDVRRKIPPEWKESWEKFLSQEQILVWKKTKKSEKEVDIKKKSLKELLGSAPFEDEDENLKPQIGVVRGLAWTSVGGDTLSIEVNVMPGKGKMELTGCMGDVMKESAQIGLSYVRSIAEAYGIDSDYFEKHDIHLHIPEGAVPKDGPSAGITMALAILSAITEIPVRGDIAMTGEITLRGKVLPIGGLKEKLLAAKIVGVKEVLVPARNKRNVAELDEEIISGLKITYVEEMNEVIKCALKK